ncbi:jg6857 [Pararge aegeria aegeria]|uniref:Jg6857 protein n=1 Tax=Pararge aegeria aegeria TaxID=348720 RepID=A0A8S4QHM5_9NEOP|nr:jg6857 [Pararge aegeria aegeria]
MHKRLRNSYAMSDFGRSTKVDAIAPSEVSFITANMLCAGWHVDGRGACFGDSGTGLVFRGTVVGIASFVGSRCASAHWPTVYARVSRYVAWIRNHA